MKQMVKKILIIVNIGLILISTKVYATSGKTINDKTRIRKEPSTDSNVVNTISKNTEVEIIDKEGDWYKIKYSKDTGYIRNDLLSVEKEQNETTEKEEETTSQIEEKENEEKEDETKEVKEEQEKNEEKKENIQEPQILQKGYSGNLINSINIKILPLINSSDVATVEENTQFTITDIINKWCYIQTEENSGWVLLSKIQSKNKSADEQTTIEEEKKEEESKESEKENSEEENTEQEEKKEEEKEETKNKEEENTTEEKKEEIKYVATETLNLREKAETDSKVIAQLKMNTQVAVIEITDSTWTKIKANGKTGYVASKYLSDTKKDTSSRSEDLVRNDTTNESEEETKENKKEEKEETSSSNIDSTSVVEYAKKYLGCKYVSGGTTPTTGFDCSGFTYYVFKNFGITLGRTASNQASNGVKVSKEEIKEGDLIIFNNSSNSSIGHVGIYIGGNKFIHAANGKKGVITTSMSDSYYKARYVVARRVI